MPFLGTPEEARFWEICEQHGVAVVPGFQHKISNRIDFWLPRYEVYVEVKSWSCERLHSQLESVEAGPKQGVIVLVGMPAVEAFGKLLGRGEDAA